MKGTQDDGWEFYDPTFPKILITGEKSLWLDRLMRKRAGGKWIYRRPTEAEISEIMRSDAW